MKTSRIALNVAAVAAAGVLGFAAAGVPEAHAESASRVNRADLDRLGRGIARDEMHVTAEQLNKWLIEERKDYALIDVRTPKEFESGHIKTAVNIAVTDLLKPETLGRLPRDKSIVLYSNVTDHAAQAAIVLQIAGLKAYSLLGGFDHWVRYTLEPQKAPATIGEQLDAARRDALARYIKECPPCLAPPGAGFTPPLAPAAPAGAAPRILEGGC